MVVSMEILSPISSTPSTFLRLMENRTLQGQKLVTCRERFQCRYSWTLYCDWNLGIWQRNRFSHPNIAEVVFIQATQEMEINLINLFRSWYWVLILDGHSKDFYPAYSATLMISTRRKVSALSCDKKLVGINKIPVNTASAEIKRF
jgi:hypothetical protein